MSKRLKNSLHCAGGILAAIGVVFLLMRLWSYEAEINLARFTWKTWSVVVALSLAYGASNLMLALAWRNLLQYLGVSVTTLWAIRVYGLSQIGKYVPGNIFHLAGRQALGAAAGLPHLPLAKSTIWDLGLMIVAGCLFGLIALPMRTEYLSISMSLALFVGISLFLAAALLRLFGHPVGKAFVWYVGFLLSYGLIFVALVKYITQPDASLDIKWVSLAGSYVLAWLAGLVTPGAPAGLGVRELVMMFLLQGALDQAEILLAVTMGRLVTAGGDLLYFLVAMRLSR